METNTRRALSLLAAALLIAGSIFALRMALHLYTDHEQVDVFHFAIGTVGAVLAVMLLRRNIPRRG